MSNDIVPVPDVNPTPPKPTVGFWEAFKIALAAVVAEWIGPPPIVIRKGSNQVVKEVILTNWINNSNNLYVEVASKVLNSMKSNKDIDLKTFDPMTIWMIIQIIYQVVKCYMNKKMTPKSAIAMVNNPNLLERALLKKLMNKAIRDHKRLVGSETSQKAFKAELYGKLLELGQNGTVSDLERLQAELPEVEEKLNV